MVRCGIADLFYRFFSVSAHLRRGRSRVQGLGVHQLHVQTLRGAHAARRAQQEVSVAVAVAAAADTAAAHLLRAPVNRPERLTHRTFETHSPRKTRSPDQRDPLSPTVRKRLQVYANMH